MTKTENNCDPVTLAQELIRCPSVTPIEGGALEYLENIFTNHGFTCHRLLFSDTGTPDVDNLYATIGIGSPHLCFAGHTDVVPTGDEQAWVHPPFGAIIEDNWLYGRGAVDMKGGIASFIAASLEYLSNTNFQNKGRLSFLITGDEEGPSINGTPKMLKWLEEKNIKLDHCLVGEPTNPKELGQEIKIGRRGSLNGTLSVKGKQGHVAYPSLAQNPIPVLIDILQSFLAKPLDNGTKYFAPSNLEITNIEVGNTATNIIPESAKATFNIRFNDNYTGESLKEHLRNCAAEAVKNTNIIHEFRFPPNGNCFLTAPGKLSDILSDAIHKTTGATAELSTSGGTSDARFIKDFCPVIEFGHVNETIHQINERVAVQDLHTLKEIYQKFIISYYETFRT